jgi:hypothetical protein
VFSDLGKESGLGTIATPHCDTLGDSAASEVYRLIFCAIGEALLITRGTKTGFVEWRGNLGDDAPDDNTGCVDERQNTLFWLCILPGTEHPPVLLVVGGGLA